MPTLAEQVRDIEGDRNDLLTKCSLQQQMIDAQSVELELRDVEIERKNSEIAQMQSYCHDLHHMAERIANDTLELLRRARRDAYIPALGNVAEQAAAVSEGAKLEDATPVPEKFVPKQPPNESAGTRIVREITETAMPEPPLFVRDTPKTGPMFLPAAAGREHVFA